RPEGAPPAHLALPDSGRSRFPKRFATEGATRMFYPPATRRPAIDAPKVTALLPRFTGNAIRAGTTGGQEPIPAKMGQPNGLPSISGTPAGPRAWNGPDARTAPSRLSRRRGR